jgi:nicotinamidase/pyrazinamidase
VLFPEFYHAERVGELFVPATNAAMAAGLMAHLPTASEDAPRVLLLLVDTQVDFIHTDGTLSVPGAVDDTRRTIEWIFRNVGKITAIAASLDSHVPFQIFYPTWWRNREGQYPEPFTVIRSDEAKAGQWQPVYEPEWSLQYLEKLEREAKKELMIWPYHTMIGTPGHTITPALYEAIVYHSAARRTEPIFLTKGSIPETEHYSILEPEVKVPDHPQGGVNTQFLDMLATHDLIYIAGQAKSHCVLETVNSMMRYFRKQPQVITKMRILADCMSSVAHPTIDFDALANQAFEAFAAEGLQLVLSTDPLG